MDSVAYSGDPEGLIGATGDLYVDDSAAQTIEYETDYAYVV